MIFKFTNLKKHPSVFRAATGLTSREFDDYAAPLAIKLAEQLRKALERRDRQRAIGGGRNQDLDGHDQFLLTGVSLRLYPTYEVLGYLFGISDSSAYHVVERCLPLLEDAGCEEIQCSQVHAARKRGYNLEGIIEQIPGLAVIVDAKAVNSARSSAVNVILYIFAGISSFLLILAEECRISDHPANSVCQTTRLRGRAY